MADARSKNLSRPDETIEFPLITVQHVDLGDMTVGRVVTEPGWRWHTHVRPRVGGDWCQARHVGVVISGRLGVVMSDGTRIEVGPDDVFEIPPGHDGFTIGDEPCVQIEWTGLRALTGYQFIGTSARALVTLLLTDLVESTQMADRLGDGAWREVLSGHFEMARSELERHRGREVNTTGDGLLATFEGPAAAIRCAEAIRSRALPDGLKIRASVHVGEVEVVGTDVRGIAVHAAARILGEAASGEILVSATTRALAEGSGFTFEDRGTHVMKGLPSAWELFAVVTSPEEAPTS